MIQFNLLPDVKQEYIKTQRIKRLVIGISFLASIAALVVFLILVSTVYLVQRKSISDLSRDIKTDSAQLESKPNIADILTVQGQLTSLSLLNAKKPSASRLFGYLSQLTPTQATISDLQIDFAQNTVTINGNAPSLDVVNTFVDGLKYTNYSLQGDTTSTKAFSSVVLASFSRSTKATYSITLVFDPTIFNNAKNVSLTIGGQPLPQQPSIIFRKSE
jgi:Tfp pilus assembly protein PilN